MATGTLVVRVWEEGSRGLVAGATVHLWNESGTLLDGTTDASGSLEVPDLAEGWVGAWVKAPGFATSDPQWQTVGAGTTVTLHFAMEPGVAVEGVVVAADGGAPVVGATIEAVRGRQLMWRERPFAQTTTDESGRFRVAAVPRVGRVSAAAVLVVSREGFATQDVVARPTPSDPGPLHFRIALPAGATLRGFVRDGDGRPVGGARVEAHHGFRAALLVGGLSTGMSWHSGADGDSIFRPRAAIADANGEFRLDALRRGEEYTLVAKADGRAPSVPQATTAADDAPPVELRVLAPGRLVVRVVDADGRPVEGAAVSARGEKRAFDGAAKAPGTWRFGDVGAASVFLRVAAPGLLDDYRQVKIRAGRTTSARVTLKPALHVAGVVVDDLGAPVARAAVGANARSDVSDDAMMKHRGTETDAEGRFRLSALPAAEHRIVARSLRGERGACAGVVPPADDVRVVVPRGVTARARFVPPAGSPAPREVHFAHFVGRVRIGRKRFAVMDRWRHESVRADDGVVEITALPVGGVDLRVIAAGFQRIELRINAAPGATVDLGEIALEPALELAGRVLDADGAAVPGAQVSVDTPRFHGIEATPWDLRATADADGAFRLRGLWRGRVKLFVHTRPFAAPNFEIDVDGTTPVTLTLPRASAKDAAGASEGP